MARQGRAQIGDKDDVDGSAAAAGPPAAMRELQSEGRRSEEEEGVDGGRQALLAVTTPFTSTASSATSSSLLLRLPPELFAGILDHLPLYSHRTLANLCLVCRALLPMARSALYERLEIVVLAINHGWLLAPWDDELLRSLRTNAHLPPLVKDLTCWTCRCSPNILERGWGIDIGTKMSADGRVDVEWLQQFMKENRIDIEATWHELFTLVAPHLRRMSATSVEDMYDFEPLLATFSFPNVGALKVDGFSPALISSFPSLTELNCAIQRISAPTPTPPSLPALQTLSLTSDNPVDATLAPSVAWLTSSSHTSLRILTLPFTDTFPPDAFLTPFPHLAHLTLESARYDFPFHPLPQHPPARHLPALPLSLTHLTLDRLSRSPSPASTLAETFLSSLRAPNLVSLTLTKPNFHARVFAQLVADTERLPRLRVLDAQRTYSYLGHCEAHEGWGEDDREELQKACDQSGVRLLLPLPWNVVAEDGE